MFTNQVQFKAQIVAISLAVFGLFPRMATADTPARTDDAERTRGIEVGVIGDQTYAPDLAVAYSVLRQGVSALAAERRIRLVLHVGDLLESSASEAAIRSQFAEGSAILNQLPVPWYLTAGDHDVNPPIFKPGSSDRSRERLFQELYGARVAQVRTHPYYSVDQDGYHFVALYSHETLHADPRWGDIFLAQISDAQLAWLSSDLEQHRSAKAVVVFLHQPLWYHWSSWQRVHDVLKRHRVVGVLSGHFHYDQDGGTVDGIRYLTVGATGGSTKTGDRNAGAIHHVSVLSVSPRDLAIRLLPLSDRLPLNITPRLDMDRVQTLDLVLGELWNFASSNPVYLKAGTLVDSCTNGNPAKVALTPIGNPIDKPLDVQISFDPGSNAVALASPHFLPQQCQQVLSDYECQVEPGARVWSSNYSSVQVDPYAGPLWEAGLVLQGGNLPPVGTALNFTVRLAFSGQSGHLYLERRISTPLLACP